MAAAIRGRLVLGRSVLASLSRSAVGIPALWSKTACLQNRSSSDTATHNPVDDAEAALRDRQRKLREKAFTEPPVDGAAFVSTPQQTSNVFYQPTVLTARQRQVYESVSVSKAGLADHGFLYGLTEADLSGRSDLVRRALSTRTGSTEDLLRFRRSEIVKKYGTTPVDTGASRVQVAILTERINRLSTHLGKNRHDKHSKRSLGLLTVQRRHLLEYMMRRDYANYRLMVSELGLRQLPVFHSRHLPKDRERTHAQVRERNARLRSRVSRGHLGH